jgi:uncharacterized membrane protein
MAGIGFRLRSLGEQDNLLAPMASIGHSAIIATGPWIYTVIALSLINAWVAELAPIPLIEGFRLLVIYAFAISLAATAPVVIVATRLLGDAIYLHSYARIRSLFVAALLVSGGVTACASFLIYALLFGLPARFIVAGVSSCSVVGLIWVSLAFCGAVRNYRGITLGFLAGLCVAVLGAVWAAGYRGGPMAMVWAFDAGLMVIFCVLTSQVLTTFPQQGTTVLEALRLLCSGMRRFWRLALGSLLASIAIWIDKWVIWAGPDRVTHESGLVHAPLYDSAMFTACLAIIPALSLFVTHVETTFFEHYRFYYNAIKDNATLSQIEDNARALEEVTTRSLTQITLVQAALCAIVALSAPSIVGAMGLHFQQVGVLRLGALGVLFQFVFIATTTLLLFFERHSQFLFLQAIFLILQGGLTAVTVTLGATYYGFGYLIACVGCGLAALAMLEHTMRNLTFITFILSNSGHSAKSDSASVKAPG